MKNSNIRLTSNIYPIKIESKILPGMEPFEIIAKEGNEVYFQQMSDLEALKTACDSCSCTCDSCMATGDLLEKPWGRVRVNGTLVDICKCQRKSCERFYTECRPDFRRDNGKQ